MRKDQYSVKRHGSALSVSLYLFQLYEISERYPSLNFKLEVPTLLTDIKEQGNTSAWGGTG